MALNIKNLPDVIKQAHASVYNMGVVTRILEQICQQNRAAHDELKILAGRLKEQLIRNAGLKHALAQSEKERLEQAEGERSVVNENDSRLLKLHKDLNDSMMQPQKQAQTINDEKAKLAEFKKAREILEERNKTLEKDIIDASKDKQQEAADQQVELDNGKNERKTLEEQIVRLQLDNRELKRRVDQAETDKIQYQDLKRRLTEKAANDPGIKKILSAGVKYNSNIKF